MSCEPGWALVCEGCGRSYAAFAATSVVVLMILFPELSNWLPSQI